MVRRFIRADITTPARAPRIDYPEGWYENVEKIVVAAYDDLNRKCIASLEDEALFDSLMTTGRVEELTEADFLSEVARLRPLPPDFEVRANREISAQDRAELEAYLESKGWTHRIRGKGTTT